ncbi:MAG: aminoacetone oxidase family FAD-binding enzyme [Bacilli bacterium]|nr:aminoacetone oxidase family FAD-binding enzyme [Bacilli bacterium]
MKKIAIIGGGASGLMVALTLKKELDGNVDVEIYERNNKIGRKILMSGNGKGNISNFFVSEKNYNNPTFVKPIIDNFKVDSLIKEFFSYGLSLVKDDSGRMYPQSDSSNSILDILRIQLDNYKVKINNDIYIDSFEFKDKFFWIDNKKYDYLVIAAGSIASNKEVKNKIQDSVEKLGHSFTKLYPSLSQILTNYDYIKSLSGVRVKALAKIAINGEIIKKEYGEVLFKDKALSGIVILNLSAALARKTQDMKINSAEVILDLLPNLSTQEVFDILLYNIKNNPWKTIDQLLLGQFNKMISLSILKDSGIIDFKKRVDSLSANDIKKIVDVIKNWEFRVSISKDLNNCQVICGGVDLKDVESPSLESKKVSNLYFCGEFLNIDGECGGFNLHFAFASGYNVASSIIKKINSDEK